MSQQKKYDIHWLTGQFCDEDKEVRYRNSINTRVRFESRLAARSTALDTGNRNHLNYSVASGVFTAQAICLLHDERDQNRDLLKEIKHRKSLEAQLRMVAERDALTGVDSRSHFMKRAEALLQRSQLERTPFCLFMTDVDHFKRINDIWGHTQGDLILTKIAEVCEQSLRPTDVIGRFAIN